MKQTKENKGITLIVLVITIIILLILTGIAISILGENGLFEKAKIAKQKQIETEVKEKINLLVSEYAIEKEQGKTLSDFLTDKKDSRKIDDFVDNNDGTFDIIIDGYTITIDESNLNTTEPQILSDIMVTCLAKAFTENKVQALITIKSKSGGIKEVRLINNVIVQGNNKALVAFDNKIEANTEYQIEVELTNGTKVTKTIKYEDTEAPTAKIEITNKVIFNSGKIQANIKLEDNRSGVHIAECKWVVLKSSEKLGTEDEALYTGTFRSIEQSIASESIIEAGEYYIHLLLKDNVGNVTEIISEKIEIKDGYAISTPEELQAMGANLEGNYYIVNDIDMTDFEFTPIDGTFTGILDGQGHTISNLKINSTTSTYTGIFIYAQNATVKNILLKNVNINNSINKNIGVLVGKNTGNITIEKVGITGNLSGKGNIGSFIGTAGGGEIIQFMNCYAITNLNSAYTSEGGFCGTGEKVINCTNCYWSGTINQKNWVGTFKPSSSSNNQHNANKPVLSNCYYNKELFILSVPEKYSGIGLTTDEFADSSNFLDWDFINDWYIDTETGYPELKF